MNVCHVVNVAQDTTMACDLATTQCKQKEIDDVGILAWNEITSFRGEDIVDVHCLEIPEDRLRITREEYHQLKKILSTYDVVHVHHHLSGFYAKVVARRLKKTIISTDHNNHQGYTMMGRLMEAISNVFVDDVVCVSESVRDSYSWWERALLWRTNVSTITNGVDIDRIETAKSVDWSIYDVANIDEGSIVVGSAGMLIEQKAHDVLLEAIEIANRDSDIPIEVVISGDGELRSELEAQITNAEYGSRMHLLGFLEKREQVYKMMHEVDVCAMPSRWEGFCVAALEGLATENAAVFSDIPEFRRPFGSIAAFHEPDNHKQLAEKIVQLTADKSTLDEIAKESSMLVVREHSLDSVADRYLSTY